MTIKKALINTYCFSYFYLATLVNLIDEHWRQIEDAIVAMFVVYMLVIMMLVLG